MGQWIDRADVLLLDIEGTTTPVDYVFGTLFPFAQAQAQSFLRTQGHTPEVQGDLALLHQEYETDVAQGIGVPAWNPDSPEGAVPYIHALIQADRKSTALKSLQGKMWEQGYRDGTLRSQLFDDVAPTLRSWVDRGKQIYIFSSGSVQAQESLFRYTEQGDLTSLIQGYFDTRTGPKRDVESYRLIATTIGTAIDRILFVSDVTAELAAARSAGMSVCLSVRPGNAPTDPEDYPVITSLAEI
ncbi:MAG: acireductone synthase [Prochlorothrix sp.]|nr:acireductone synthase [Prochlorothrix sp.]